MSHWIILHAKGRSDEAIKMETVLQLIYHWRNSKAEELHMAPVSVIPDHVAKDLETAGVRIIGVEDLAEKITNYIHEHLVASVVTSLSSSMLSTTPLKRGSIDGNPTDRLGS